MFLRPIPPLETPWRAFRRAVHNETKHWQWDVMLVMLLWILLCVWIDSL